MERIYLECLETVSESGQVTVGIFLKDVTDKHYNDLIGFLRNQYIECYYFPEPISEDIQQKLTYFDECFYIVFDARRWSFFDLRRYIKAYITAWEENVSFCGEYLEDILRTKDGVTFNDSFYLQLSEHIDKCEDKYYYENNSLALFINSILKLIRDNLQVYWTAAKLENFETGALNYINYYPAATSQNDAVTKSDTSAGNSDILMYPVNFKGEHIAEFFIAPSPFSPEQDVIDKFVNYIIMHIDDFIYGAVARKKQVFQLKSKIAELKSINTRLTDALKKKSSGKLEFEEQEEEQEHTLSLSDLHVYVIGDSQISKDQILSEFVSAGFDKRKIKTFLDYKKIKNRINTNNLLRVRSKYDVLLFGPEPHNCVLQEIEKEPELFCPHVRIEDKKGHLKITKKSLKSAVLRVSQMMNEFNNYQIS